jgi:hypothetical protein
MPSKPPGILGQYDHSPFALPHGLGTTGTARSPGPAGYTSHHLTLAEIQHRAAVLAHEVSTAMGWHDTHSVVWRFLGGHSFTAGVVYGLFENFAHSVIGAADMLKTFALAEYWESQHGGSNAARIRAQLSMATLPVIGPSLAMASAFAPRFHLTTLDQKAKEAFDEREAIIEAVKHVFTHPKDFLGKLSDSQVARVNEFKKYMAEKSLSGSFEAGKLLGELLFDVLMVIDLAAGLAKLAAQVPKLARFTEDFAKLAGDLRTAKRLEKVAKDSELVDPPPKSERGQNAGSGGSGRASSSREQSAPPPPPPPPPPLDEPETPPTKPPITRDRAFQMIEDERARRDGMEPLGDALTQRRDGQGTVALLDVGGDPVIGVNSTVGDASDVDLARAWRPTMAENYGWNVGDNQTLFHAEGQSLLKAYDATDGNLPEEMNMFVDRKTCSICTSGLPDLMDSMGVKKLNVFFKDGTSQVITSSGG